METAVEKYKVADEPFYLQIKEEVELFEAAYAAKLPVMLKGPTGCGKTRFVEYMAYRMNRPLITVACHEDLSSTDLVGRFLDVGFMFFQSADARNSKKIFQFAYETLLILTGKIECRGSHE